MRIGKLKAHAVGLFLSDTGIRRVTAIIDDKTVFRLTRYTYKNKDGVRKTWRNAKGYAHGVISLSRPNYLEARVIKKMKANGEKFPKMLVKVA